MPDLNQYHEQLETLKETSYTVYAITAIALAIHDMYKEQPPANEFELIHNVRDLLPPDINQTFNENIVAVVIKGLNKDMSDLRYGKQYIQNLKAQQEPA